MMSKISLNPIERLKVYIKKRHPNLVINIDSPEDPTLSWYLDVERDDPMPSVCVQWKQGKGFGVSFTKMYYGEKHDEVYGAGDERKVFERVVELIEASEAV